MEIEKTPTSAAIPAAAPDAEDAASNKRKRPSESDQPPFDLSRKSRAGMPRNAVELVADLMADIATMHQVIRLFAEHGSLPTCHYMAKQILAHNVPNRAESDARELLQRFSRPT